MYSVVIPKDMVTSADETSHLDIMNTALKVSKYKPEITPCLDNFEDEEFPL